MAMGRGGQVVLGRFQPEPRGQPPRQSWWRRLLGGTGGLRGTPVILDRRLGERRHRPEGVPRERRRAERRHPVRRDLSAVQSHLGTGSQWDGELVFTGVLHIDGHVASPGLRGGVLIIGEQARVQAAIDVAVLQVRGQVEGEIRAGQRVELLRASRVTGTIWAPRVEIWPGAIVEGRVHLESSPQSLPGEQAGRRAVTVRAR
jgi:cytoskeletal protein CcmA (bactofilin family)